MDIKKKTDYVLIIEHYPSIISSYKKWFSNSNITYKTAESVLQAFTYKPDHQPALIIVNTRLIHCLSKLEIDKFTQTFPYSYFLLTEEENSDAMNTFGQLNPIDKLSHPIDENDIIPLVKTAIDMQKHRLYISRHLESSNNQRGQFHDFIGTSQTMQAVYKQIESAADSKASIFIKGESGTGKEVCAQAIHKYSLRKTEPFIAINCAAIPKDLIESEIFGHVKGAFTGATNTRVGAAESADGGTLFLDELCEMDLNLQAKLLRFIQTGSFQKVGANQPQSVDVRFICATNRNPEAEVESGRFREDLYYRLHVIPISLPPLREREVDSLLIAHKLMAIYSLEEKKSFSSICPLAMQSLQSYPWPGNIRELQNVMRQTIVLNKGSQIKKSMLPLALHSHSAQQAAAHQKNIGTITQKEEQQAQHVLPLWEEEKKIIERAIALCNGNIPKAAASLEVSASTIYRKKQAWQTLSK